ncbi:tRNA 4-thiouridine(8) synthase ThiI [Patescibacteria group bacterium]|nr:tRNA 4-thiouridine(8) synthase ThiI [Patescibacteria group bacterium]
MSLAKYLIVHYHELGLKGNNKDFFVKKLVKTLRDRLNSEFSLTHSVKHSIGRIYIPLEEGVDEEAYARVVGRIFGIRYFGFYFAGDLDVEKLGAQIFENLPDLDAVATFRVKCKRSQLYPLNSSQVERELGAILLRTGIDKKVKMEAADLVVQVEIFNEMAFFSFKRYEGAGGLPVASGGRLLSLISTGIDSPVASYLMMRRGAKVYFVHFHSYPYTDEVEVENVKKLVKILCDFGVSAKLYLIPLTKIQETIAKTLEIPAKYRVVLYRRMMIRLSEMVARKVKAKGLITGDSFGQVASQTTENMYAIREAASLPIYSPLIAFDKEDVVNVAEKIGTFEISRLPCKDTCAMFSPKHPVLDANPYDVRELEKFLDIDGLLVEAYEGVEILDF